MSTLTEATLKCDNCNRDISEPNF